MKTFENYIFWIAIVAIVAIGAGRFLMGGPNVMGFKATSPLSVLNTALIISIIARLRSK